MRPNPALLAALAALVLPAAARAQTLFTPANYPAGQTPAASATADLDADGNADLVVSSYSDDAFKVFLGFGNGSLFAMPDAPFPAPYGTQSGAIALAEMTGDGRPDLVSPTYYTSGVAVMPGQGNGAFGAPVTASLPAGASAIRVADFDGDGRDDVLASSAPGAAFYFLRGLGGAAFSAPTAIPFPAQLGGPPGDNVEIADFNLDGKLDFAAPWSGAGGFSAWRNLGGGSFALATTFFSSGTPITWMAAGQVVFAGPPDVVFLSAGGSSATIAVGDGAFGFTGASLPSGSPPSATRIAIADVDGVDGPDLVFASPWTFGTFAVSLLLNQGMSFSFHGSYATAGAVSSLAPCDLDANGLADLVCVSGSANAVTVLRNLVPPAPESFSYGSGTPGCGGRLGLTAGVGPSVGDAAWRVLATNAPPRSNGLLVLASLPEIAGADPVGIGAVLHVDLLSSSVVEAVNAASDPAGFSEIFLPVPNNAALHGITLSGQMIWVEKAAQSCSASPFGIVTSRGYRFMVF